MKRSTLSREAEDGELNVEQLAMANCAMLLSRVGDKSGWTLSGQVFKCKTCPREFNSFQALGGHRASHKRLKLMQDDNNNNNNNNNNVNDKKHLCSVCGQGFGTGQALGGHMRRHRGTPVSRGTEHLQFTTNQFYSGTKSTQEEEAMVVPGVTKEASTITTNTSKQSFMLFGVEINATCP